MQKLQVYIVVSGRRGEAHLTRNPEHLNRAKTIIVSEPQPSWQAYLALRQWEKRLQGRLKQFWLRFAALRYVDHPPLRCSEKTTAGPVLDDIVNLVSGYLITEERLFKTLRARGFWPADLSRALDRGVQKGILKQLPGIRQEPWGRQLCSRCGGVDIIRQPCANCGLKDCPLCRTCSAMGANRGCTTLITAQEAGGEKEASPTPLSLTYDLTPRQAEAAEKLLEFWQGKKKRALLWAACGAGKTEVSFPLIQKALSQGERVLFAIPRADIVREVGERLRQAFPKTSVAVHYGGQPLFAPGKLVVATTHQVLRFYRRFGLIVLDEVDAFPYRGSEMLRFGLQRSLAHRGKLVEMTATPQSLRQRAELITIPVRFHGQPLPVPAIKISPLPAWDELSLKEFPASVLELVEKGEHPWLVFAPTIAACEAIYKLLRSASGKRVGICHSKHPQRLNTISRLRQETLDIVVTTSVLERGVNFPRIGVVVLYAEHAVFSADTLVQIAGRVGRTAESPGGTVLFLGRQKTSDMRRAVHLIRRLNEEAARRGLLADETS